MWYNIKEMRVFSAIPLPKDIKDKFSGIARGKLPIPYVNTTNLHITLNFFGELDTDQVKKLLKFWDGGLPKIPALKIEFDKLVKFRQQIHMTLKENPALRKFQAEMENLFRKEGFTFQEREYYPHVKLGNLHMDKVMHRERKIEGFPNEDLNAMSFTADRVVLYESKLLLHHPHHIELAEHKLLA